VVIEKYFLQEVKQPQHETKHSLPTTAKIKIYEPYLSLTAHGKLYSD
jgi:hypothetical protein